MFPIRTWSIAKNANVAALGHPLGASISLNQGRVVLKRTLRGVPMLAVRVLAAEGGSGSPLVDSAGRVVGILQLGLGATDLLGQRTAGVILGIDLPSWWRGAKRDLCRSYPYGGIPDCEGGALQPPDTHEIAGCWTQYTAGWWDESHLHKSDAATSFSATDIAARNPLNFAAVLELKTLPVGDVEVVVRLVDRQGNTFASQDFAHWKDLKVLTTEFGGWTWDDGKLFYQHPESTGNGAWTFVWTLAGGETCSSSFSVG